MQFKARLNYISNALKLLSEPQQSFYFSQWLGFWDCHKLLYSTLRNVNLVYVLNSTLRLGRFITERFYKSNTVLLEDFITAGLSRYRNVWNEYLASISALNLSIRGSHRKYSMLSYRFFFTVVREKHCYSVWSQEYPNKFSH